MAAKFRPSRVCRLSLLFSIRFQDRSPFRRRKSVSFARNLHRCTLLHQNQGSARSGEEDPGKCVAIDVGIEQVRCIEHQAGMDEVPEPQRHTGEEEVEAKELKGGKEQEREPAEPIKMTECFSKRKACQEQQQIEEGKQEFRKNVQEVIKLEKRDGEEEPCACEYLQGAENAGGIKEEKEYFPEGDEGEVPPQETVVSNGDVQGVPGLFVFDREPGLSKNLYIESESAEIEKVEKVKCKKKLRRKGMGGADVGEAQGTMADLESPSEGAQEDGDRIERRECKKKSNKIPRSKDKRKETKSSGKLQRKEKNSLHQKPPTSIDFGELPADFDTPCVDLMGSGRPAAVMHDQLRQSQIKEQRQGREKKLKDKTKTWFEMPRTELTPEIRQNLLALRLRDYADPTRFYKPPDRAGFPKHFQMGTVLNSPAEFYSARISRKQRQRNFLEEMMADAEQRRYRKRRIASILAEGQAKSAGKKLWLRLGGQKLLKRRGVGKDGKGSNSALALKKRKEKEKKKQRRHHL
uniref:deoxynucleotidyltransferase terminal-interacting protein 2 n=1 Tax=Myxine glutinosa TaxID=7769 RepID=UPI003590285E